MRKTLGIVMFFLAAAASARGAAITVSQPAGGSVTMGSSVRISWTASGVSANVKILLRKPGGALVATIAGNLPVNASPYAWTAAAPAVAGESYKIHVRAIDGSAEGESAVFTVAQGGGGLPGKHDFPAMLKLESPNGGESWHLGSDQVISWSGRFLTGNVQLQLYRHPCCAVGLIAENLPASGSYSWKAGHYLGNTAPAGQYNIRVVAMDNHTVFDKSDAPFDLKPHPASVIGPAAAGMISKPDLVVCAESAVYTSSGVQGTIHVKVRNIGTGLAKAGFAIRHSVGNVLSSAVVIPVDLLPGGEHSAYNVSLSPYEVGTKLFVFMVDSDLQVTEENEGNNHLPVSFTVTAGPLPASGPLTCSDEVETTFEKLY